MRLIDADELKEDYHMADECKDCKTNIWHCEYDRNYTKMDFCVWLDSAPTVDAVPGQPERKKGEWIYGEHDIAMCDGYWCDQCGFFVPWDYKHKFIDFIKDYHWCPSCGADMRGDDHG